ncbi:uncharacterized protein K02A2.6-like, partial [Heteronotia binoei]|uniref:uncharacterized protein K02A2.6-like n=1 Tax=Heteronotia binoei TaxID=13085 RepID=UPI0029304EEB
ETHPGIVRMKALARSYVWWPGMDGEIENWVRRCSTCQESRPDPPSAPATRWETTRKPWSRLHIDFAGPFQGQIFLIIVDAYTKWLEVVPVGSTSSAAAIRALRRVLCTHGIPDTIVSDNGAAFTSGDFQAFLQRYLIRHIRSAPFHPATNGQAERMVRTTKEALGSIVQGDWDHRLAAFLFDNRVVPNPVTGVSPAELLMGRKLTTRLDRLNPDRAPDMRGSPEATAALISDGSNKEGAHQLRRQLHSGLKAPNRPRAAEKPGTKCASCEDPHKRQDSPYHNADCRSCKKVGHVARACRARPNRMPQSTHHNSTDAHTTAANSNQRHQTPMSSATAFERCSASRNADLKVKWKKCLLGVPRVEFLRFAVNAVGIHPMANKTRAIAERNYAQIDEEALAIVADVYKYNDYLYAQ